MAQKTEKEETEFKVPETLTLCVNNCGVTGNPATNNMCQNCFNASTTAAATTTTASTASSSSSNTKSSQQSSPSNSNAKTEIWKFGTERSGRSRGAVVRDLKVESSKRNETGSDLAKKEVNRCTGCRRKVGLTGFRCRCGELFCSEHRYSDRHDCSYDYKAAGREAIARENPVVKAAKIVRV